MLTGCTSAILVLRALTGAHQRVHVLLCCRCLVQVVEHLFVRSRFLLALGFGVLDGLGGWSAVSPDSLFLCGHDHFT